MEGEGRGGEQHLLGGRGKPPPHERRSLLLVLNEAFGHEVGDLHRQPRTQLWGHSERPPGSPPPSIRGGWDTDGTSPLPPFPLTPNAMRCAKPNLGTLRAHRGLKWSLRQILPPLQGGGNCKDLPE